ncbi:MAG: PD-(D/E)XK nuclease family protein [Candidatus Azambacteria bacterium]|nr:PD-(D/E)XK nuclease family protein [Candidatus Azambacteria bacterium]
MSKYYHPPRIRGNFNPDSKEPFTMSRTGVELFAKCRRCFYLDKRFGVAQPPGFPFSLNSAVDALLKKEFDIHRVAGNSHPLMKAYGIDAVPFAHTDIEEWRDALRRGISFFHEPTNIILRGGIDDIWKNNKTGELHVVDYKATAKNSEVTLDAEWQISYKRQMEVYQWLFRQNGFKISDISYFVYVNGRTDKKAFDGKLEFDVKIIPYTGNDSWVETALFDIQKCLAGDKIPKANDECDYCLYRKTVGNFEK